MRNPKFRGEKKKCKKQNRKNKIASHSNFNTINSTKTMSEKMFHTTKSKLVAHGKMCTAVSMQAKISG